jgi:tRNA U34 5-methylaminomethyl-2-thiouridine-forming methyltransferase MnmC
VDNFSYKHPRTGEWAHNQKSSVDRDASLTYIDPVWDRIDTKTDRVYKVLEIGYGRGFNAAEFANRAELSEKAKFHYVGLEPCPEILEPWPANPPQCYEQFRPAWGKTVGKVKFPNFILEILPFRAQSEKAYVFAPFDIVIVDLFSPSRHPEEWEPPFLDLLSSASSPGAILTSYCCAKQFREGLVGSGWRVKVLKNIGWRDTLIARKGDI